MITIKSAIVTIVDNNGTPAFRAQIGYNNAYGNSPTRSLWVNIQPLLDDNGEPMTKDGLSNKRWDLTGVLSFGWWNSVEDKLVSLDRRFESEGFIVPTGLKLVRVEESESKTAPTWCLDESPTFTKDDKTLVKIGDAGKSPTNKGTGMWYPYQGEKASLAPVLGDRGIWFFRPTGDINA